MNVICPNCQTPNDESHRFCSNCATPLAKPITSTTAPQAGNLPPPPGPPPLSAPVPSPVASGQAPAAPGWPSGQAPVRLSPALIIGGVVASIVIVMTIAVALGTLPKPNPTPTGGGFPTATPARSTPGPTGNQPSPTPIANPGTPAPAGGTPTPSPGGGGGGTGQLLDMDNIAVTVPSGWTVTEQQSNLIDMARQGGGQLILISYKLKDTSTTVEGFIADLIQKNSTANPDATTCIAEKDLMVPSGPPGRFFRLCYTAKTQSGQAVNVDDGYIVAIDEASVLYEFRVYAADALNKTVVDAIFKDVVPSIRWKLFQGD